MRVGTCRRRRCRTELDDQKVARAVEGRLCTWARAKQGENKAGNADARLCEHALRSYASSVNAHVVLISRHCVHPTTGDRAAAARRAGDAILIILIDTASKSPVMQ